MRTGIDTREKRMQTLAGDTQAVMATTTPSPSMAAEGIQAAFGTNWPSGYLWDTASYTISLLALDYFL